MTEIAAEGFLDSLRRRVGRNRLRHHWRLRVRKTRFGLELLRNYRIDRRYGGSCAGATQTPFRHLDAYGTSSADYVQLRKIFTAENGVPIGPDDVLVDVGCGKGRVLNHWLEMELDNRIVGIELDRRFAGFAADRLSAYPNVEVICGDAIERLPTKATVLFLFNPFGRGTLIRFADRVANTMASPERLVIVYYFAMHADVFERDPRFVVEPFATATFHPGVTVRLAR
jgi:SAM-dependent methyltransferase